MMTRALTSCCKKLAICATMRGGHLWQHAHTALNHAHRMSQKESVHTVRQRAHLLIRASQSKSVYFLQPTEMLSHANAHAPSASTCLPCNSAAHVARLFFDVEQANVTCWHSLERIMRGPPSVHIASSEPNKMSLHMSQPVAQRSADNEYQCSVLVSRPCQLCSHDASLMA